MMQVGVNQGAIEIEQQRESCTHEIAPSQIHALRQAAGPATDEGPHRQDVRYPVIAPNPSPSGGHTIDFSRQG
jgi:hypothetical protein